MITVQDIILNNNNITPYNAKILIDSCNKHIGYQNGVNIITDISYIDSENKDIELTCNECGNITHQVIKHNKWYKVHKTCPCQKQRRITDFENSRKIKRASAIDKASKHIGKVYGDYEIVDIDTSGSIIKAKARCVKCGSETTVSANALDNGWKSSTCKAHYNPIKFDESYIGKKNNRLTVIGIERADNGERRFRCRCECGNETLVKPTYWETGVVKSCGCLQIEVKHKTDLEHTPELDRLRRIYGGMKQRCYNPNYEKFKDYGGRGIRICDLWLANRDAFIEWALANGYDNSLSIDRIDNNGNYEPGNCRWADAKTQRNNQRDRKPDIQFQGKMYFMYQLCDMFNITKPAVQYRMNVNGMTLEEALTTPKKGR